MDRSLVYVGDPMCSWCWGFAPELRELCETHRLPLEILVGGLRPGPSAEPLDGRLAAFLRREWARIAETTGQPFDVDALDGREGWVYDTEPAARAVVTMREMAPASTLDFFETVQRAFYAGGIDVTDLSVYPSLIHGLPVDEARFMERLADEGSRAAAWRDFADVRRMGVNGFPTLLLREGPSLSLLARGYRPAAAISPLIDALTAGPESGAACEPGGVC